MQERFQTRVFANNSNDALSKARDALKQLGYKLKSQDQAEGIERYERGELRSHSYQYSRESTLSGALSTVILELVPTGLSITIEVTIFGTILGPLAFLPSGIRYWQAELALISSFARGEVSDVKRFKFKRPFILKIIFFPFEIFFIALSFMFIIAILLIIPGVREILLTLLTPILIAGVALAIYNYSK
jgi:hypothetical protein